MSKYSSSPEPVASTVKGKKKPAQFGISAVNPAADWNGDAATTQVGKGDPEPAQFGIDAANPVDGMTGGMPSSLKNPGG
jgi:hypothetical protein